MKRLEIDRALMAVLFVLAAAAYAVARVAEYADSPAPAEAAQHVLPLDIEWTEARACWLRLVRIDDMAGNHDVVNTTVNRFLESAHSRDLLLDLCSLFESNPDNREPTSLVKASLDLPEGSFQPPRRGAEVYEVTVQIQHDREVFDETFFVFGQYPDNPDCAYTFYYQSAISSMAQVLYHELLHIWFLNEYAGVERRYPTGHGLVTLCEFDDEFLDLLAANAAELGTIEGHPPLNFGSPHYPPTEIAR
jgi:hypothetical protein